MKTMHLFAGAGGGLLADRILGHEPIIAVEWDGYACSVLRARAAEGWFPGLSVWEGDVRLFDPSEYTGIVDCIHAGFPCQDLSVAGAGAGLGEGTRSGLYREVIRIASLVRPAYIFMENVSAILGRGMGVVLGDLAQIGYNARWMCLRASDVGAPHHRDRWFCLAKCSDTDRQWQQQPQRPDSQVRGWPCHLRQAGNVCNANDNGQLAPEVSRGSITGSNNLKAGSGTSGEPAGSSCEFALMANPNCQGAYGGRPSGNQAGQHELEDNGADVAHPCRTRWKKQYPTTVANKQGHNTRCDDSERGETGREAEPSVGGMADGVAYRLDDDQPGWWEVETGVGRVSKGMPDRVSRIKALGNGQVPLQVATVFKIMQGMDFL